jgi:hypothetical protein
MYAELEQKDVQNARPRAPSLSSNILLSDRVVNIILE